MDKAIKDDETTAEEAVVVDYSFQNHAEQILRKGRHAGSNFRRTIFDRADLTEETSRIVIFQRVDG